MTFQEELAYDEGKVAGLDNLPKSQWAYTEGSNLYDFYQRGFNVGYLLRNEFSKFSPEDQEIIAKAGQPNSGRNDNTA